MAEALKIPADTLDQQFKASDPNNSSWLSANAGSGKTHVLTQRVIRLLLDGNAPDRIMCLTFTKAAASNMKNRVFSTLANWTTLPEDELAQAIENSTGKKPTPATVSGARKLFAKALDTPGGLKIQTIHGFCESLLHQFPLEANIPGHFETVTELEQSRMLAQSTARALSGEDPELAAHLNALIPYASDMAIADAVAAVIADRENFRSWIHVDIEPAVNLLYGIFEIGPDDTETTIKADSIRQLPVSDNLITEIQFHAAQSDKKTDQELATHLKHYLDTADVEEKFTALCNACLTKTGALRSDKRIATKLVTEAVPQLVDAILACGNHLLTALEKKNAPALIKNSRHLFELAFAVLEDYERLKRQRGLIDFDDQIERASNLLNRSEIREWIRFRLDRGVDHILVDEAQDTSPAQWHIINAICDDFHSGEGAQKRKRTVFVVGDEKQSIFSFQGAEPKEFAFQEKSLEKRVREAGMPYHPGKLHLSFRSTKDVLHAVDKVFEDEQNRKGLSQADIPVIHDSVRENHPGEVQIWPLYQKEKQEQSKSWLDPVDHLNEQDPVILLSRRITDEIKALVGKPLPGMDRPLEFRDILILVRSRNNFITALTRTMKDADVQVAGADRVRLTQHIAVEDLLAVGRTAILPQDDLSLACSLKSLFFNISEEELFSFSVERAENTGLFDQIVAIADQPVHPARSLAEGIREKLAYLSRISRTHSVFEFYAILLGEMGGRKKLLSRLGSEAEDVIDAFMDEALAFTRNNSGALEEFLAEITRADPEIKREVELDRDEVRILTVHASKGLEAPVVFLVDSCGEAWREAHRPPLIPFPSRDDFSPMVWLPGSDRHTKQTRDAVSGLKQAAEAEYRRLLYVGMTRAADRLIVCGYHGLRAINHYHWHQMIKDALQDTASEMTNDDGTISGWRWVSGERQSEVRPVSEDSAPPVREADPEIPDWLTRPIPVEPNFPRPLTPSGAASLISNEEDRRSGPTETNIAVSDGFALERGVLTHKLLEILPGLPAAMRREKGVELVTRKKTDMPRLQQLEIVETVCRIFEDDKFSHLFENEALSEVSVAGWINAKEGPIQIAGQIDRLIVMEDTVMILDYKTNQSVPAHPEAVSREYLVQLGLYRDLIKTVYPDRRIISALLWTQKPELMAVPDGLLDDAVATFKK